MLDGHICLSGPSSSSLESTAGERTRCEARQEGEARRGKSSRPRRTRSSISASRRSLVDLRSILGKRRRRRIERAGREVAAQRSTPTSVANENGQPLRPERKDHTPRGASPRRAAQRPSQHRLATTASRKRIQSGASTQPGCTTHPIAGGAERCVCSSRTPPIATSTGIGEARKATIEKLHERTRHQRTCRPSRQPSR